MRMWVGKEREGIFKGVMTLFVGDKSITYEEVKQALDNHKCKQVYFGAGRCTTINQKVVVSCMDKLKKDVLITIEVLLNELHTLRTEIIYSSRVNFIVTFNHINIQEFKHLSKNNNNQLKIQNLVTKEKVLGTVPIAQIDFIKVNDLRGKKYKGDKVII